MLATNGVMALPIDGGLIVQIGRPRHDIRTRRLSARGMIRVYVDADRTSIAFLASPTVDVVCIALKRDSIDDAGHQTRVSILSRRRVAGE
jgi:hypothetical protein